VTYSNEPLVEPETDIDNPGLERDDPSIEGPPSDDPDEDPESEFDIVNDADDDPDDEDLPLVDATENG
jgi:hypothetical protein